jgi:hypothetical protein
MKIQRTLRRSQVVNIHGPGAIVDIGDESFTVCGIESWNYGGTKDCPLPRLARRMRVAKLRQPKSQEGFRESSASICMIRFPRWMFCQKCRKMKFWKESDEEKLSRGESPGCHCHGTLVPMRFVKICENGHMDDIDWNYWVHRTDKGGGGPVQCRSQENLYFKSSAKGGSGLSSLVVECQACGAHKSLQQLLIPRAMGICRPDGVSYGGRQPWQRQDQGDQCCEEVKVVQRGDSNLHYPRTVSALDIPESSDNLNPDSRDEILLMYEDDQMIELLRSVKNSTGEVPLELLEKFASTQNIGLDIVMELVNTSSSDQAVYEPTGDDEVILRGEEYPLLVHPDAHDHSCFSGKSYSPLETEFGVALAGSFESISLMHRLREVRVFQGFHRVRPGDSGRLVAASLSGTGNWLPACEIFGEGVFFQFNRARLSDWTINLPRHEISRFQELEDRIKKEGIGFLPDPCPELVLIHGFAHILMRQLCFECGYASSSLRERLYVNGGEMAGVLIYTADGDSEGTLGGLVRQGEPDRLPAVILRALHTALWCSGDPLCRESENQGMAGLNQAACHACLLASETSCELANALLDRRLLIGDDKGLKGYFLNALEESGVTDAH